MINRCIQKSCLTFCVGFLVIVSNALVLAERTVIAIGTSKTPLATAFNNARKIVRTSDDILLVVYQDSVDQQSVVTWTWSADGFTWTVPQVLGYGELPALAIDEEDHIYAVWRSSDARQSDFASFERESPGSRKIKLIGTFDLFSGEWVRHHSLEASASGLHLVYEYSYPEFADSISYVHINKNTLERDFYVTDPREPTEQKCRSRFPSITGDLEFEPGFFYVLWTDSLGNQDSTRIGCWKVPEVPLDDIENYDQYNFSVLDYPSEWEGKSFPSISVRGWENHNNNSDFVMACSDIIGNQLMVASGSSYDQYETEVWSTSTLPVSENPMPSVDDVLPFSMSCAIVWQRGGEIYYGQAEDANIITQPPVQVSESNGYLKQYPSVCYKTFRADSFDVVWTEGNRPPYKVMYRRMPKCYMANPVKVVTKTLHDAVVGFEYKEYIHMKGGSDGPYSLEVISGAMPRHFILYRDESKRHEIWGDPDSTGVYHFTIRATDFAKASSDTASYVLVVKEAQMDFRSPDSVVAERGRIFSYTARAVDPFGGIAFCSFTDLPSWLTLSDSIVSGIVPPNSADTCFKVIASYRHLSDTMAVTLHLIDANGIDNDRNPAELPNAYALFPNYPNPFNPSTTILFAIPKAGNVSIELFDVRGSSVKRILNRRLDAGYHSMALNGEDIPSGVYLIRMCAEKFTTIHKCILLK